MRQGPTLLRFLQTRRGGFVRDRRGFTGAEKALLITIGLAIVILVGALLRGGSQKAGQDAERTLASGFSLGQSGPLGQAVGPMQANQTSGAPQGSGAVNGGGAPSSGGDVAGVGQKGQALTNSGQAPAAAEKGEAPKVQLGGWKADGKSNRREGEIKREYGGAKKPTPEGGKEGGKEEEKSKFSGPSIEAKKELFKREGALAEKTFGGEDAKLKLEGGAGAVGVDATGKASFKEGLEGGVSGEARVSAFRATGDAKLPLGIKGTAEGQVLSANANIETKAGISREVVGAKLEAGVSANIAEGKVGAARTFKIPFTNFGVELSGGASGAIGANAAVDGRAGYFKGQNGQPSKFGFNFGAKAALGLGGGLKLGLNLVWD